MIITRTPLRLSLLGGNTDIPSYYLKHGGYALSVTLDKYIYCIVNKRFDNLICVNYSEKEVVENVSELKHELVREALILVGITNGIEISFMADIPSKGSGLGSSSAVTVGVLNALYTYIGENVSSEKLALDAIRIELEILKKPIGVQDQYIVAYGGFRTLEFYSSGVVECLKIVLKDETKAYLNNSMSLFYSGITRSTNNILSTIDIIKSKKVLDQNKILAEKAAKAIQDANILQFGRLLDKYWMLKKSLSGSISNTEIDRMYNMAKAAGAIGAKVIGAGGGGFLLVVHMPNKATLVSKALKDYKKLPFSFHEGGSAVIFDDMH